MGSYYMDLLIDNANTALKFIFIGFATDLILSKKKLPRPKTLLIKGGVLLGILLIWALLIDPILLKPSKPSDFVETI